MVHNSWSPCCRSGLSQYRCQLQTYWSSDISDRYQERGHCHNFRQKPQASHLAAMAHSFPHLWKYWIKWKTVSSSSINVWGWHLSRPKHCDTFIFICEQLEAPVSFPYLWTQTSWHKDWWKEKHILQVISWFKAKILKKRRFQYFRFQGWILVQVGLGNLTWYNRQAFLLWRSWN